MRAQMLPTILSDLSATSTHIQASALISSDGLIIASLLPSSLDEDRVGAISAAMFSLGDRTVRELGRGTKLDQVLIKGENGFVLMTQAGPNAVLTVLAKPAANLGMIFLDVKRAADALARALAQS